MCYSGSQSMDDTQSSTATHIYPKNGISCYGVGFLVKSNCEIMYNPGMLLNNSWKRETPEAVYHPIL